MKRLSPIVFLLIFAVSCSKSVVENAKTNAVTAKPASTAAPALSNQANASASPKGERGTPDEAKAMLEKAVEHYSSAGREMALSDFTKKKAPFGDRDLYVACIGSNDKLVANGGFPNLVGTSVDAWKDADGNQVGKAIRQALAKGEASVKYNWYNPVTRALEHKVFFFQKVGDDICGVGAYTP